MARISLNNGSTIVDVSTLTDQQIEIALEYVAASSLDEQREAVHGLTDDPREFVALFCERVEAEIGEVFMLP
jgi:hypothetical protein